MGNVCAGVAEVGVTWRDEYIFNMRERFIKYFQQIYVRHS